jgi:hypothetical protein
MTEFRHTLRFLATHKSFTAAAVLTLAIGLGANTALFGLVNVVLRPLDIPEPDRLVAIAADTPGDDSGGFQYSFSLEVVGVARNSKYVLVFEPPRPFVYLPLEKTMKLRTLHVRAKGDPSLLAPRLEHEIADLSRDLPIAELQTMRHSLTGIFGYFIFELGAVQAAGMGILGLALALVGVYGVVSFGASLRTREVGIRMALGAQPSDVLRLILGQGVSVVAVGLIVGLAVAWALGRALTTFIPLARADWFVFLGVALVLGALAIWACYVPARRATRVPAMTALRHE